MSSLYESFILTGTKNGKSIELYRGDSYGEVLKYLESMDDTHNYYKIEKRYGK